MFGLTAEEMEHLGDDRLGRALDRLFDADRAALITEVVVTVFQLPTILLILSKGMFDRKLSCKSLL
jgi:hypothetical protein